MIAGPSYSLRNRSGSRQRAVNLIPVPIEASGEVARTAFKDWPGLVLFANIGLPIRGGYTSNGVTIVVAGSSIYRVDAYGSTTVVGALTSSSGPVDFDSTQTQICITDGLNLYVIDRTTNALTITTGYPGGVRLAVLSEYLFMVERNSGKFWWSDIGDASTIDGLSFATAEASPDTLTACIVSSEELLLFGRSTIEPWRVVGGDDPVAKTGRVIEVGSESPHSIRRLDNSVFFVGSSEEFGKGIVYRLSGYTPQRISTRAVEEKLSGKDLSNAVGLVFTFEGDSFYVLQVPGLDTTLVYGVMSGMWFEVAEFVDGAYQPWRGAVHVFGHGHNLIGSSDGKLYRLDAEAKTNAGDVLCRSRVMPEMRDKAGKWLRFPELRCFCDTGSGGWLMVRWSDDGGNQWGDWEHIHLGDVGNYGHEVSMHAMGSSDRRVYELRVTDPVPWNPSDVFVRAV